MNKLLEVLKKKHQKTITILHDRGLVCEDRNNNGYPEIHLILDEANSLICSGKEDDEVSLYCCIGRLEALQDFIIEVKIRLSNEDKTPKQKDEEAKQAINAMAEEAQKKVEAKEEKPRSVQDLQFKDD